MKRSLRILLAIGSFDIGGTERQVVRLACELRARGHDVTVLALNAAGPLRADLVGCGVPTWDVGLRRGSGFRQNVRSVARLLMLTVRLRNFDVVHAFLFWTYVIVLPVAWLARVPVRLSGRRNLGTEKSARRWYPWLERLSDAASTGAVANAVAVANVVAAAGVARDRIVVIPNGIDLPEPAGEVGKQPPRGVIMANLIPYKGHLDLVAAMAAMEDPPRIDAYGDGPARHAIEAAIRDAELEDRLVLHGQVLEAASHYRDAQFAVLTSHEEGFPNAILEAMAAGLPVVATAVGGVPELVEDHETGVLVPPQDGRALTQALSEVARSPAFRQRVGAAARERVARDYSWDHCVEAHERLYSSAIRSCAGSSKRKSHLDGS